MYGYFGFEDSDSNNFKFFIEQWAHALYTQLSGSHSYHPTQIAGGAENRVNENLYNSIKVDSIDSQTQINEKITITLYNMFYGKNPIITSSPNDFFKSHYTNYYGMHWATSPSGRAGPDPDQLKLSENEELVIINKDDGTISPIDTIYPGENYTSGIKMHTKREAKLMIEYDTKQIATGMQIKLKNIDKIPDIVKLYGSNTNYATNDTSNHLNKRWTPQWFSDNVSNNLDLIAYK